jgi:hypothetical protein
MLLTLRHNYFLRSFWALRDATHLTDKDIKYIDLDVLNKDIFLDWLAHPTISRARILGLSYIVVNVSYWNTYNIGLDNALSNSFFIDYLLNNYLSSQSKYGIKNFRTDNMCNSDFLCFTWHKRLERYNPGWKTAHITGMLVKDPHWNMYRYRLRHAQK